MTSGTEPVQGTAPPDQPHAMSAEDVVQASLAALQAGEVVCIPGLDDHEAVEHLARAETELRQGGRAALAARYAAR